MLNSYFLVKQGSISCFSDPGGSEKHRGNGQAPCTPKRKEQE